MAYGAKVAKVKIKTEVINIFFLSLGDHVQRFVLTLVSMAPVLFTTKQFHLTRGFFKQSGLTNPKNEESITKLRDYKSGFQFSKSIQDFELDLYVFM